MPCRPSTFPGTPRSSRASARTRCATTRAPSRASRACSSGRTRWPRAASGWGAR
ncbi:hypothetical protein BN1708_016997 [Verticillium longisporum]|uniref:Uncharacterized protein n=1 Tax=Verticillium longisporum TaxID=100787 RepID=A0A0G4KE45_VERLO|nr:hypothetical protein BN1708_016997 [Verticillium longisporum]